MFEIEQGHEVPPPSSFRSPRPSKYPLREMEPGESFLIPVDPNDKDAVSKAQRAVTGSAARWKIKIVVRKVPEGVRVWRAETNQE